MYKFVVQVIKNDCSLIDQSGQSFKYVPTLNSSAQHVELLVNRIIDNASA